MELVLIVILVIIVVAAWGLSSVSQSLASAKQAQAAIESAKAAQVASTGNLVTILMMALVILVVMALIFFGIWLFYQTRVKPALARTGLIPGDSGRKMFGQKGQPNLAGQDPMGLLTQMMAFQMYQQMQRDMRQRPEQPVALLEEPEEDNWLF